MVKKTRKRKKKKLKLTNTAKYLIFSLILIILINSISFFDSKNSISEQIIKQANAITDTINYEQLYQDCINNPYNENDNTLELQQKETELTQYLKNNYQTSVKYQDIKTQYTFTYNPGQNYYAASTIKILDAIYIYTKASQNELDLDATVKYLAKFKRTPSLAMQNHKIGEEISLRDLVKYAITVSDNTAHEMLLDYIGFNNLKNFGNSLGATKTLIGGDSFGTINVDDSLIYLNALYEFVQQNPILGQELIEYFINSDQNYLNFPEENILAAQKYGEYGIYYHENGIVYTSNPYFISILTTNGKSNYETVIRDINTRIRNLHDFFYQQRESYCQNIVYQ